MYVDKYSDRLSQEERALSEAAVAKKRKTSVNKETL